MGFTTDCFIRKNTEFLRRELGLLGYIIDPGYDGDNGKWLANDPGVEFYTLIDELSYENSYGINWGIDCDENDDLFLGLAALRDDSDFLQWFIEDNTSEWYLSETSHFYLPGKKFHKATPEEIIKRYENPQENIW